MRHLRHLEAVESMGHLGDSAEMSGPLDLSACGIPGEMEERVLSEEDETQLAQPEAIHFATESEVELPAAENQRSSAEIKTLSKVATEQIDRMEQASARLALLEQIRLHAETMVYQRADREIRLQAEIEALRRTEAAQLRRIEEAEAEAQARQRAAAEALQQAEEEARRLAEEEEQRIEHLETIRRKAEASSHERSEKERLLTSQLLAFGEAAAEQLKRIERAEADLGEAEKKALQFEEDSDQKSEQEAIRVAETDASHQATEEQFSLAETQASKRVQEEDQTITQLDLIRGAAEMKAQQCSGTIQRLNAEIEALRKTEVEQSQRIEEAKRHLHQMQAATYRLAQEEEQRLADLESFRSQAETRARQRREKEQELIAALKPLSELEAKQLKRIAEAEAALLARPEGLQAGGEIHNKENHQRAQVVADRNDDAQPLANDFPLATSNAEPEAAWWVSQFSDQADLSSDEEAQLANDEFASSVVDPLETSGLTSIEDSGNPLGPVRSQANIQPMSDETSSVSSLAERIRTGDPAERADALQQVAQLNDDDAFSLIASLFDGSSAGVRNAAARALYDLRPNRIDTFTRVLREASPERRRQITRALVSSGLAAEAIDNLASKSREKTDDAFSMLFLMAKAGEFQSLLQTIEMHPSNPVKLSVIKLLTFCNRPEIIPAFRNLAVRGSLPTEIRSALLASIYEMRNNARENSPSAA